MASGGLIATVPSSGAVSPASIRSSVDLPAPLTPTRPTTSPGPITRSRPENSTRAPWPAAREVALRVALITTKSLRTRVTRWARPGVAAV